MPVIRVSCPANALTAEQKAQLAPLLTDGVMGQEVDPVTDAGRDVTSLMFNEIADHNCFIGGRPVEKPKIGKLAGTDPSRQRFAELQANTAKLKATRVS
jgi:phenylpyruvate tautomerase PptA (4-oxalocrotonate tautomerase family)